MITGSHLIFAKIIYEYILKNTGFRLDYSAFAYGNIKPDIDKSCISCDHTYEGSISAIKSLSLKLTKRRMTLGEFSEGLGVVCHFVCDYFCLHHSLDYWKKNPMAHGIYEVNLHAILMKLVGRGRLNLKYSCSREESVEELLLKLRRKYRKDPENIMRDINYSIMAGIEVSRLIVCSRNEYFNRKRLY